MKIVKRLAPKAFLVTMSILVGAAATSLAETDEPGPFQKLFRALKRGLSEPQHKSTTHHSSTTHKQQTSGAQVSSTSSNSSASTNTTEDTNKPPDQKNTRSTSKASTKKGEDLPYGTPVPGKQGFVTSPFSPNSGYIDVRGFAPGTPVKDPYTGKVFLTP